MLTRFIPDDSALPQLASVVDVPFMQRIFERHLQGANLRETSIAACEIERIKYRPGRNCIVGYKLKLRGAAMEMDQRLCVGIYTPDEAVARYEKARAGAGFPTPGFAPVTLIPELNMVVWAFPNERKLAALPSLLDAEKLREKILPEVVHERWGNGWEIVDTAHAISNYFPEHSCCVSVALTLNRVASNTRLIWEIIGKTRYTDGGEEIRRHMNTLSLNANANANADVAYARPIAYQRQHRLLWQERVPGVTLHSLLAKSQTDPALLVRVARAVAALHSTPLSGLARSAPDKLSDKLVAAQETLIAARPACAAALRRVVATLLDRAKRLPPQSDATWHGDLHSQNILVSPTQVYLIDMDRLSIGPPLADLGSFLAELAYRGCLSAEPFEATRRQLTSIVAAYRQRVSWPVSAADVAWFTACALIHERALRCVTSLKLVHAETLDKLISLAAQIVDADPYIDAAKSASDAMENAGEAA